MKRILALIVAVLMLATVFVGCGNGGNKETASSSADNDPFHGEDNITLKVWAPNEAVETFQAQCEDFIALYPDKKISIEVVAQGEADAATNLLNDPDAAADVFGFACNNLNKLYNAGVITPVYDEFKDDVTKRNSEESINAATLDNTLLAYPETGDNGYYLVYDKSVVSDEDAKTLEGILAACRKAGKKFVMDAGNGFYSCMFTFTGGMELAGLNEEGTQQFNDYNEDEVVASMQAFSKLFHEYKDIFESADVSKVSSGMAEDPRTVAAGIDGSWNAKVVSEVLGDDYGAAKLPTINIGGKDTQIISMHGYKLIGVNYKTKYPETSQLLANYLSDEKCQLERAEERSWGPSNLAAVESDVVKNNIATSAILEQAKHSVAQVGIADTFWDPMKTLGNKVYKPEESSETAALKELLAKTVANIKDE